MAQEEAGKQNQIRILGIGEKIRLAELQSVVNSAIRANKNEVERYEYQIREKLDEHIFEARKGDWDESRRALSHAATATQWLEQATQAYGKAVRMSLKLYLLVHSDEAVVEREE